MTRLQTSCSKSPIAKAGSRRGSCRVGTAHHRWPLTGGQCPPYKDRYPEMAMRWFRMILILFSVAILGLAISAFSQTQPANARDRYKEGLGANESVERMIRSFEGKGEVGDNSLPTKPADAVRRFKTAPG